jgi:hypothetical protein
MNLRHFTLALLVSALPLVQSAQAADIKLNKGDFLSAEKIEQSGEVVLSVKLSKSGKAKFKKLNKTQVNQEVESSIAGVENHFKLREPIRGDKLQIGPFSASEAEKVFIEINKK